MPRCHNLGIMCKGCGSMRKSLLSLILLLAIVGALAPFYLDGTETLEQTQLKRFSSYEELKLFLETNMKATDYGWKQMGIPEAIPGEAKIVSTPEFSTTNIQVAGVDEADIVKTDGTYLYVVAGSNIFILKAYPPEEAQVLSQISFNTMPWQLFINEDKLAVLGSPTDYTYRIPTLIEDKTFVKVYDVSDRKNPVLTRNFSISGNYFNSRMINEYVYVVVSQPAFCDTLVLPKIYSEEGIKKISASQIYYAPVSDYDYAFTTIVTINLQDDEQEPTHETFLLGATSCMYASLNNIYITFWKDEKTLIYRIRMEEEKIEYGADGEVPGYVLNQFSMDEYEGYFRIATTMSQVWSETPSRNNVYVFDMDLNIIGKLEGLASGETIYSARFMGDRCYLVTFRKVDPLFVIDLKDPSSPKVLGQLKITGYSDYLHPYDENHILGVGKETVEAQEGDFAWYQGVKISLFDVSDVEEPKEIAKYEIGDRGTDSPILSDHKALLFDKSKKLLVIPVLVAEINEEQYSEGVPPNAYGDYVWQGAYVFSISLNEGLMFRGRITHIEDATDLMKNDYYFSYPYFVKRSLYIDNVLYTISDKKIKMNSLENLDEINEVEFS